MERLRGTTVPPVLPAVAAIVSVQFGSAFARGFFDETGPLGAAALRLLFGFAILLVVVRPRVRSWDRGTWLGVLALGVALAGMNALIYQAIARIPLGIAVTVEFLGPLLVALVQVRRMRDAVWALLAGAGVVLLGIEATGSLSIAGLGFAIAAAVCWAGYIVFSSRVSQRVDGVSGLAVAMTVSAIVVVPLGLPEALPAVVATPSLLAVFALIAVLTSALPYALEFLALKRMPTRVFGVLSSLGPAVSALAGLVVLGQALEAPQLVALVLVSVASVGVTLAARRPLEPALP